MRPADVNTNHFAKSAIFALFLLISLLLHASCASEVISEEPEPTQGAHFARERLAIERWIDLDSVETAIATTGLPWTARPSPVLPNAEPNGIYELFYGTIFMGAVSGTAYDNVRVLHGIGIDAPLGFPNELNVQSREDWDSFIMLFTHLFGGFDSGRHVLDYFNAEIDYVKRHTHDASRATAAFWEKEIGGIYVEIVIARHSGAENEHLRSVLITNDRPALDLVRGR